jgi:hypothetical protein
LGGNQFNTFEEIKPLSGLENLIDLDLFGCKICEDKKYREKVYGMFPNLMVTRSFKNVLISSRFSTIAIKKERK